MKKILLKATASLVGCALAYGIPAHAQTVPTQSTPAQTSAQPDDTVTEVIVTGQRRSEKMQTVAIAETVLSGDQLKDKAVTRVADLQTVAPALTIADNGLTSSVNIRGIGLSSGSPQVSNGVATYVDGLFQPPIVQSNSFYDIANVEVLRGPQGTLVGSNSTGGAVLITTQNPKLTGVEGYLAGSAGSFNAKGVNGAVNLPLGDHLAIRLAATADDRDSYYTDHGPFHNDAGSLKEDAVRLGVLWKYGNFQALLKTEQSQRQTGGSAYKPIPGTFYAASSLPGAFDLDYNSPTSFNERAWINGLELKYQFDNGITIRSLTGYQDKKFHGLWDIDASEATDVANDQLVREKQTTQEFNIISPTTGRFNWILGTYYQHNVITVAILQTAGGFPTNIEPENDKVTKGAFVQLGYKLTDRLDVQLGLRQSSFESSGTGGVFIGRGIPGFPPGGLQVASTAGRHADNRPTGKLSFNYKPDANNMIYVFAARGYKSGGFNSSTSEFAPETVTNYEAGWKSTLLGGHLKTQVDAFANNYKNFQLDVLDVTTGGAGVANLPPATINGAEGQFQARFGAFNLDGGFAYVDSHLGAVTLVDVRALPAGNLGPQCPTGTASNPPLCFDYVPFTVTGNGGPNLLSPKWTYNLSAAYTFNLGNDITLTPRLSMSHQDASYSYVTYAADAYIAGRTLYSGVVTLQTAHWNVDLYGTNLSDETYVVGQAGLNQFYGAPREIGVRVRRDF